jgi:hypothetical protein
VLAVKTGDNAAIVAAYTVTGNVHNACRDEFAMKG